MSAANNNKIREQVLALANEVDPALVERYKQSMDEIPGIEKYILEDLQKTINTTEDLKSRIRAIVAHYEPSKVKDLDAVLAKWTQKEDHLLHLLVEKYGPEPQQLQTHAQATNENNNNATTASKIFRKRKFPPPPTPFDPFDHCASVDSQIIRQRRPVITNKSTTTVTTTTSSPTTLDIIISSIDDDDDDASIVTVSLRLPDGTITNLKTSLVSVIKIGEIISRITQNHLKLPSSHSSLFCLVAPTNEHEDSNNTEPRSFINIRAYDYRYLDNNKTLVQENVIPLANNNSNNNLNYNLAMRFKYNKLFRNDTVDLILHDWYLQQVHEDVVHLNIDMNESLAIELAALRLQQIMTKNDDQCSYLGIDVESLLPITVGLEDYEYWQKRLFEAHQSLASVIDTPQARTQFLATFRAKCAGWGLAFFGAKDTEYGDSFSVGIGEDGLFIFDEFRRKIVSSLPFGEHLCHWSRNDKNNIITLRRRCAVIKFVAASENDARAIIELLDEYYLLLPQEFRNRFPSINITRSSNASSLQLPDVNFFVSSSTASSLSSATRPSSSFYSSRLEHFKAAYMEHLQQTLPGEAPKVPPNQKLFRVIDHALDFGKDLEEIDLSCSDPPVDDTHFALLVELLDWIIQQEPSEDATRNNNFKENIVIKKLNLAQDSTCVAKQKLTEYCITNVCNFIRRSCLTLTHVDLSFIPLDNRNEKDIAHALQLCPYLESLALSGCKMGDRGFAEITEVFLVCPSRLKNLDVSRNSITSRSIRAFCSVLEGDNCILENLNIGFNAIDIGGIEALAVTMKSGHGKLRSLNIASNVGCNTGPSKIADLVAARTGLTDLNVSSNNLTGAVALRVCFEVRLQSQIRKLDLSNNPLGPTLVRERRDGNVYRDYPAEFFMFLDVGVPCILNELVLDRCDLHEEAGQALAGVMQSNSKLQTLVVSHNMLASQRTGVLPTVWSDTLEHNYYLSKLDLSFNGISAPGVMAIFDALRKNNNNSLQELILDGNVLKDGGINNAKELLDFLEQNRTVRVLSLNEMKMPGSMLLKIAEGLVSTSLTISASSKPVVLSKLVARQNEITASNVIKFAEILNKHNDSLKTCDFSGKAVVSEGEDMFRRAQRAMVEKTNVVEIIL